MADQGYQERTEKPTSRRRRKAREEGKVARSNELNAAAVLCLGFLSLYALGPSLVDPIRQMMRSTMANAPAISSADVTFMTLMGDTVVKFFLILLPVFAILGVVAVGVNVAQVGFAVSPKALEWKLDKLNLAKGFKRLVSLRSLVQMIRDSVKLSVIGFVAYQSLRSDFDSFFSLPDMSVGQMAASMGRLAVTLALKIGGVFLVIAVLDYLYQRYEFEKSIRMSKQEVKDELKDTEGSPQLKARVRQMQREVSRARMMQVVPAADVVVTNPTHLAVALKYAPDEMDAPEVVAKGARLVAKRIIGIAREHDIPVIENKPLAQSLFKLCDIGQVVPVNLYRAVAELLAHVYRLKGKVTG